jgi:outer membrane murein-binding lipoprotein Lpp
MGFLDKAKQAAGQAAVKAREGVEDVQTKRELGQAYSDLGKTVFELMEAGELSDARFEDSASKIRTLKAKLEEDADSGDAGEQAGVDPDQPPAMPT